MTDSLFKVNRLTLDNGLRVVHNQDTSTAMVALNVLYDTGARDEDPALTGIAHLYEHMMFGGSENIADFDGELTAAGGESNAYTSNDFTDFYEVAPAHNAETLFHLESDRMLRPALTQAGLDVQRQVVIEEFKQQCLNRPYGDVGHHLRGLVYGGGHPYAWPVIGKEYSHIERTTQADLQAWFNARYSPGNAVLAVCGNISWERTAELARKWFGTIPARPTAPRCVPAAPSIAPGTVRTVTGNVPVTTVYAAWLMDGYGTRGYYAADALTDLLAAGKAGRFVRNLVMAPGALFTEAEASITGSEHQGMLIMTGRLASEETDPMTALQAMIGQARTVITDPPTEHDMQRLKNRYRASQVFDTLSYLGRAQRMAVAEMHGESVDDAVNAYNALTSADIADCARRLFNDSHPAVVIYRPEQKQTQL